MVAHEGDLAVALVGRAVDLVLPGLAPKAADLVGGGWREAAAEVFMEEQVHSVALDKERVVQQPRFASRQRARRPGRIR